MGVKPTPQIISRKAAHGAGLRRFYTGDTCKAGHVAERYVSNGGCTQCTNVAFQFRRNAFSTLLVPFASTRVWTCATFTPEEVLGLERYMQTCIAEYAKHIAKLTPDLEDAFRMQLEKM